MTKNIKQFYKDIARIDELTQEKDAKIRAFDDKKKIDILLDNAGLDKNEKNRFAITQRIHYLRDDLLLGEITKKPFDEYSKSRKIIFEAVCSLYHLWHNDLISKIKKENLLTNFYISILSNVHNIGISMSKLADVWLEHTQRVNKELLDRFGSDKRVIEYLEENNLFDKYQNKISDRCYSVLVKQNDKYISCSYAKAFSSEIDEIVQKISIFINELEELEDDLFNQKQAYISYLQALKQAFANKDVSTNIQDFANIDIAWMSITSAIQIGHPLEYYEDKYRKSVAIEWDIRLCLETILESQNEEVYAHIKDMSTLMKKNHNKYVNIFDTMDDNLSKVQLYLGRAMIYYGSSLNGLFSAQVVPNDEYVSKKYGKKIFAFAKSILEDTRSKPFMQIDKEIFPKDFLHQSRLIIFNQPALWHKIYKISTIGHEYGHILWCDENTEVVMNKTGNFKNVEELKATLGGLVSFFNTNNTDDYQALLIDIIKRSVKLLIYHSHEEVRPYYIEGLIHLHILFKSKILSFIDNNLDVQMTLSNYNTCKNNYIELYNNLVYDYYLPKNEPSDFLKQYVVQENIYLPKDENIKKFAVYYQKLYEQMGFEIDKSDKKENYVTN